MEKSGEKGEAGATSQSTREEADLLENSTKKAKMHMEGLSQEDTIVQETPQNNPVVDVSMMDGNAGSKEVTATEMDMKRRTISYADVCLGVNGKIQRDESSEEDFFDLDDMDEEESEEDEEDTEKMSKADEDPLCPVVRVSKEEIKEAQKP